MTVYVYKYGGQGPKPMTRTAREQDKMLRRLAKERGIKLS